MIPAPTVAGLQLCHDVAIDMDRHEITLTRIFRNFDTPIHPDLSTHFWAFATIYGPLGQGKLTVVVEALDNQEVVFFLQTPIEFTDRFSPVYLKLNMRYCRFPRVGDYEMIVWADLDIVAQQRFVVFERT
jgi:hypothetical protein